MELTILMPCLNEAETLETCIRKAQHFLAENKIDGEVLIADNGSTDGSPEIAKRLGARVVFVEEKGYGSALRTGFREAYGQYVIMGDADDSYDFLNLSPFLEKLREGYELVMGNRFQGVIEKGAMPWSHRYIGNPILSFIGRLFFKSSIRDFHCGLRGCRRDSILALDLRTTGMEFASEMVVKAEFSGLRIMEVPTTLKKDGRSRPPHLRSMRDGWRHLKFLLMYSPDWLFLYPGALLLTVGLIGSVILLGGELHVLHVTFSINTLLYCMLFLILGANIVLSFLLIKLYACTHGLLPETGTGWYRTIHEDFVIFGGALLTLLGLACSIASLLVWKNHAFGDLNPSQIMRLTIPSASITVIGIQSIFSGFMMGIVKIKNETNCKKNNRIDCKEVNGTEV